jgi:hypothetical protein
MNSDQQSLIQRLCGTVGLREIDGKINKAVYLDRNFAGEEDLSKTQLCKFFGISRAQLQRRTWSILCGHTVHDEKKTRYLAPRYEADLCEIITEAEISQKCLTKDEIMEKVMYAIHILYNRYSYSCLGLSH